MLDELTSGMRALTVLFAAAGEVDNRGFAALLYNSAGRWTSEAIRAARLVGSEPHAQVFERSFRWRLEEAEMDDDARNARLEAMSGLAGGGDGPVARRQRHCGVSAPPRAS